MLDIRAKLSEARHKRSHAKQLFLPPVDHELKTPLWQRLLLAVVLLGLGSVAMTVGVSSVSYRLTHLTVNSGFINGRTVRLRVPIDGKVKAFYARPGVAVQSGQIVARITPTIQAGQNLLRLQGEIETGAAQIAASRQSLVLLEQQLSELKNRDRTLQTTHVDIADKEVSQYQAGVDASVSKAQAARLEYERYQQLLDEGAISKQKVDELQAEWQVAEAEVKQAKAKLLSAKTSLHAQASGVALNSGADLEEQQMSLIQAIQAQKTLLQTLTAKQENQQQQLLHAQTIYSKRKDVEVKAPFQGVIYRTEKEQGEQVNRPDALMTVLDCNDLWVETLVSADQASRIETQQPVRVQLAGEPTTFVGEVELIEAISSVEEVRQQVQAIIPSVPADLAGKPLSRVTVRIPPSKQHSQSRQFCGIGQSASLTFGTKLFGS
jgi:membrane fusion protein, multidrug efflux system